MPKSMAEIWLNYESLGSDSSFVSRKLVDLVDLDGKTPWVCSGFLRKYETLHWSWEAP